MRVLIAAPEITKQGGVSNYVATLTRHLSAQTEVFTVGARGRTKGRLGTLARVVRDSLGFYRRTGGRGWDLIHLNPSLGWKAIIRDGLLLAIAKRKGLRALVFFHGWSKSLEARLVRHRLRVFKHFYFEADAMVVLAKEFEQVLRAWGYTGPIYVETIAIADELLDRFDIDRRLSKREMGAELLFLSRIERDKGIYETIDAFGLLKSKYPDLRLRIAGDGSELEAAKAYVQRARIADVEFLGYLRGSQKSEVLRRADVYVLPSSHGEGMPVSIAEAMAFGLPAVIRPVGGLRDFFVDGQMGFTTESTDPEVVAGLIERLVVDSDLRGRMARYNHEYATAHFLASRVALRIDSVYRDVLHDTHDAKAASRSWPRWTRYVEIPAVPASEPERIKAADGRLNG